MDAVNVKSDTDLNARCKYALQLHFQSWCHNHGVAHPVTDRAVSGIRSLDAKGFADELRKITASDDIGYPIRDAEALCAVGTGNGPDPSLAVCCEAANVALDTLLGLIFQ